MVPSLTDVGSVGQLRDVVVVTPGREPWGEDYYKCAARLKSGHFSVRINLQKETKINEASKKTTDDSM